MTLRLRRPTITVGFLACIALMSIGLAPASAAATASTSSAALAPGADGHFAPYRGGGTVTPKTESGVITAGKCKYKQAIDDPHHPVNYVAVHGWWIYSSGTCPSKANIDVYLQAYWCDWLGCRWVTVDSDSHDYYAGGGSGRRATGHVDCSSNAGLVGWRGYVDVDLNGVADPSGYTYSVIKNFYCSP